MPTVIFLFGWRFFFYTEEGNEPLHVHCIKAEKEAKFWLNEKTRAITPVFAHRMSPADLRLVKKIIGQYFDEIVKCWHETRKKSKRRQVSPSRIRHVQRAVDAAVRGRAALPD